MKKRKTHLCFKQKKILDNFIKNMRSPQSKYPYKNNISYLNAHHLPIEVWSQLCSINDYPGLWKDIDFYLIKRTTEK